MKEVKINVDESVITTVQEVIEPYGLEIEMVIKIMLNRISRESNLDFLLSNTKTKEDSKSLKDDPFFVTNSYGGQINNNAVRDMRKSLAISIFRSKGMPYSNNVTFASKNRSAHNYWANPSFEVLEQDWFLILNDWINRVLYLFKVPSKAISQNDLIARADNNNLIDLQILYNDSNFRDTRSNYLFKEFLIMIEHY